MKIFREELKMILDGMNIVYTENMIDRSALYARILVEENEKMNLTAITGEREMAIRHFADSLCLLKYADIAEGASLIDVGTGAGFPGMVLAIFRPDLKITLADSLKKRCGFLERLGAEIKTDNVTVLWGRAEELGRDSAYRGVFDYAAARAVAAMPVLLEYCVPFLKEGGLFLAMKAKDEDISFDGALAALNAGVKDTVRYELDGETRSLIIVNKTGPLADKYPRRPGMPEKRPLK